MEAFVVDYFGEPTDTEEYSRNDLLVVEEPKNPVFDRVVAGTIEFSSKRTSWRSTSPSGRPRTSSPRGTSTPRRTPSTPRTTFSRKRPAVTPRPAATR